jgi:GT2 family glycosyltransferase
LSDALAVVVVTHQSAAELAGLAAALLPQLDEADEVAFVDNASSDASATVARKLDDPRIAVLEAPTNVGFGAACRLGVNATRAPLLLLLNPDARPQPGAIARLRATASERPGWAAWQPAVMLPDGAINSSRGVVHFLGLAWAGQCGQDPAALPVTPYETAFASGAALLIRRSAWQRIGGFADSYFLYGEDVDLGLRLWLAGERVGVEPRARIVHDYEFDKGRQKWFLLERNRWRTVLALYPAPLLLALAPAFALSELGLVAIAARDGWLAAKLRADLAIVTGLPAAVRRRRAVRRTRRLPTARFAGLLGASLDSPYLGELPRVIVAAQAAYWRVVCLLLRT